MTVPDQIKNILGPVVNGRVYADEAPQRAKPPFITFERTSEEPITTIHCLPAATIIQYYSINVWDQSRGRVEQFAQRVKAAMDDAFLTRQMEGAYQGDAWGYDETMNFTACALIYMLIERNKP